MVLTLDQVVYLSQLLLALIDLLFANIFIILMSVCCMLSLLCKGFMGLLLLIFHVVEVVWLSYRVSLLEVLLLLRVVKSLAWLIILHIL